MGKQKEILIVDCSVCYKEIGQFAKKDLPKMVQCPHCGVHQNPEFHYIGKSHKRDYPQGYFKNQ